MPSCNGVEHKQFISMLTLLRWDIFYACGVRTARELTHLSPSAELRSWLYWTTCVPEWPTRVPAELQQVETGRFMQRAMHAAMTRLYLAQGVVLKFSTCNTTYLQGCPPGKSGMLQPLEVREAGRTDYLSCLDRRGGYRYQYNANHESIF